VVVRRVRWAALGSRIPAQESWVPFWGANCDGTGHALLLRHASTAHASTPRERRLAES
jgi:hypothetical protein